jgi:hypothetical protein
MIKVDLLRAKKKRKQKPLPAFAISMILITLVSGAILAWLVFFFSGRVFEKQAMVKSNEAKIANGRSGRGRLRKRNADFRRKKLSNNWAE